MSEILYSWQNSYGVYLDILGPGLRSAFGVEPEIVPTGGNCYAIELRFEGGLVAWITDAFDVLSPYPWRLDPTASADPFGYGVNMWRDGGTAPWETIGGSTNYYAESADDVVELVRAAIDNAINGDGMGVLIGEEPTHAWDTAEPAPRNETN